MKWYSWICGWIELAEAIVKILSLGRIIPWWSFKFMAWYIKRSLDKQIAKENYNANRLG